MHVPYPGHVRLTVTCDTGPSGDLRTLADELDHHARRFAARTSQVPGVLGFCLRSLPADLGRRSTTRYDRRDDAIDVDLTVDEERIAGATLDEQRKIVGPLLRDLLRRGVASRSAPWTTDQRAAVLAAVDETLREVGWLDGPDPQPVAGRVTFRTVWGGPPREGLIEEAARITQRLRSQTFAYDLDLFLSVGGDVTPGEEPSGLRNPRVSLARRRATGEILVSRDGASAAPDPVGFFRETVHASLVELLTRVAAKDAQVDVTTDLEKVAFLAT